MAWIRINSAFTTPAKPFTPDRFVIKWWAWSSGTCNKLSSPFRNSFWGQTLPDTFQATRLSLLLTTRECTWQWGFTGWLTKMSLFFFGNSFYKNKETFKIFSAQILEVYRILLVETTLESIMFYYTFSVINTMFIPCTTLLYNSTAATRTLKLSTTLLGISCGIHLISFLMMSSLVCGLFSQTLSFRYPLRK